MKTTTIVLIFIILLGFVLRIAGINFGLPDIYHADEPIVVNHAMAYGSGDFNPHFFNIPPLVSYLLFFFYGLTYLVGNILKIFNSPDDFALLFLRDPSYFYIIGRLICGVFFGTASIFVIYKLAKKMFSEQVALLSALFLSVCFLHVQQSHYIYVDVPMVFFVLLTCLFAVSIIKNPTPRNYLLAACFAGIATATKYNAALVFAVVPAALIVAKDKNVIPKTFASLVFMLLSFLILNPFSLFDFSSFLNAVSYQSTIIFKHPKYNFLMQPFYNLVYHLFGYSLKEGLGIASVILGLWGAVNYIYKNKDRKLHIIFLIFPLLFYFSLARISQTYERYALPLVPFLIIYASAIIFEKIKNKFLFFLIVLIILFPNLEKSLYSDLLFMKKDTRTISREWVEKNIPLGSKIAIEHSFFCPHLRQSNEQIKEKFAFLSHDGDSAKKKRLSLELKTRKNNSIAFNLYYLKESSSNDTKFLFERPQLDFSISELKKIGIKYVILHVDSRRNFKDVFFQELVKNAVLLQEFTPYIDKQRKFAREEVDDYISVAQTSAPFVTAELLGRSRNGYNIKIFRID